MYAKQTLLQLSRRKCQSSCGFDRTLGHLVHVAASTKAYLDIDIPPPRVESAGDLAASNAPDGNTLTFPGGIDDIARECAAVRGKNEPLVSKNI